VLPVEIIPAPGGNLVLRARGSELLILPEYVSSLRKKRGSDDFINFFRNEALVNRSARKLFEAWLRKDGSLWQRIYDTVHKKFTDADFTGSDDPAPVAPAKEAAPAKKTSAKTDEEKKPAKSAAKPETKKSVEKAKPAAKAKAEKEEAPKKAAAKSAAKPAAKKADVKPAKKAADSKSKTAKKK